MKSVFARFNKYYSCYYRFIPAKEVKWLILLREQLRFDKTFAIDEIVEESYERIGLQSVSGYQLKTARRSLNILFQEWGNRGIHYWEIG